MSLLSRGLYSSTISRRRPLASLLPVLEWKPHEALEACVTRGWYSPGRIRKGDRVEEPRGAASTRRDENGSSPAAKPGGGPPAEYWAASPAFQREWRRRARAAGTSCPGCSVFPGVSGRHRCPPRCGQSHVPVPLLRVEPSCPLLVLVLCFKSLLFQDQFNYKNEPIQLGCRFLMYCT